MRYSSLADEFEDLVEAFRLGASQALHKQAKKLSARITRFELENFEGIRQVDRLSYTLGALEAASDLLATTAERADRTSVLDSLRKRDGDLRVLRQLGIWALEAQESEFRQNDQVITSSMMTRERPQGRARGIAGSPPARRSPSGTNALVRSQKDLATAAGVSAALLSRDVLKRLRAAGFVTEPTRANIVHVEITSAGMAALDEVQPGWRSVAAVEEHMLATAKIISKVSVASTTGIDYQHVSMRDAPLTQLFPATIKIDQSPLTHRAKLPIGLQVMYGHFFSPDMPAQFDEIDSIAEQFQRQYDARSGGLDALSLISDKLLENFGTHRRGQSNRLLRSWLPQQAVENEDDKERRYV